MVRRVEPGEDPECVAAALPPGLRPWFVTRTLSSKGAATAVIAAAGAAYVAVRGPVTRTTSAGTRAWVEASKATPSA